MYPIFLAKRRSRNVVLVNKNSLRNFFEMKNFPYDIRITISSEANNVHKKIRVNKE